jgi:molecular chaperone DnaJ
VLAHVEIELREAATGVRRSVPFQVAATCSRCGGDGAEPGTSVSRCPTCGGAGRVSQVSRSVFGEFVRSHACPTCGGSGRVVETPCTECGGDGRVVEERSIDVDVPPGIHDGQRIRITGEGHAGALGTRAGDAYVDVTIRPDPDFVRQGDDVFTTVPLTITQAALGATVTVPTLDGEAELSFEAGTQPGEVRVLRGRGMPVLQGFGRGDQRVLVNVVVPRRLTDDQRGLLEQFEESAGDDTYQEDEGFFHKLKRALR